MLSDIEIAQSADMKRISEIAAGLGIEEDDIEPYGHYKAKLSEKLFSKLADKENGKLILVTAINPTPAGEGKTTISVGLSDALRRIGKTRTSFRYEGRSSWRRLCPGSSYGGYKPSLYRGYARNHSC